MGATGMSEVKRTVASDDDLAQLADDVVAAVIEEAADATREADAHRATPCTVTVDVEAEIVDDADPTDTDRSVNVELGP